MESEKVREKRMIWMLFVPLIIIGIVFYNMSGHSIAVLCSGIVVLIFYACLAINKYYRDNFSERLHWWFSLGTLIAGIIFLFTTISVIEKMQQP